MEDTRETNQKEKRKNRLFVRRRVASRWTTEDSQWTWWKQ